MAKRTLKILRCSHRKIFKVRLAILQHYALSNFSFEVNLKILMKITQTYPWITLNYVLQLLFRGKAFFLASKISNIIH